MQRLIGAPEVASGVSWGDSACSHCWRKRSGCNTLLPLLLHAGWATDSEAHEQCGFQWFKTSLLPFDFHWKTCYKDTLRNVIVVITAVVMTTHLCQKRGNWENPRQDPGLQQRPFYLFLVKRLIERHCLDSLVEDFLGLLEEETHFSCIIIICAPSYCVHFVIFLCFCLPFYSNPWIQPITTQPVAGKNVAD